MFKEFIKESFWPCHKLDGVEPICSGVDSKVYRYQDFVIKDYKVKSPLNPHYRLTQDLLSDYCQVTNLAHELLENEKTELFIPSLNVQTRLKVNPFIKMNNCPSCSGIEGVCKYVPGEDLNDLVDIPDRFELRAALSEINLAIEKKTGFYGLNIILLNVKMPEMGSLVITDLCADISKLKKL